MKIKKVVPYVVVAILIAIAMFMAVRTRFPIRYLDVIQAHAGELDVSFVLAVIMAESSFNHLAESHAGAQGLMQLMPSTAADMAERMGMRDFQPDDVWLPEVNIAIGAFYLNWLYARYNGDLDLVLAAYNAGLGRVDAWLADPQFSTDGVTLDTIPFSETENYLERVRQFQRVYRVLLVVRGR